MSPNTIESPENTIELNVENLASAVGSREEQALAISEVVQESNRRFRSNSNILPSQADVAEIALDVENFAAAVGSREQQKREIHEIVQESDKRFRNNSVFL